MHQTDSQRERNEQKLKLSVNKWKPVQFDFDKSNAAAFMTPKPSY